MSEPFTLEGFRNSFGNADSSVVILWAVTSGAVFGDHCSPISDTTIMASMGTGADHMDHVKTQLPYALTIAIIVAIAGYALVPFHISPIISYAIGVAALIAVVFSVGKRVDDSVDAEYMNAEESAM